MSNEFTEADRQAMDNAAADAENELGEIPDEAIAPVANWMKKYYMTAGYKRLGKLLVQTAKDLDKEEG